MPPDPSRRVPTIGFALEYVLGHATHGDNLKRTLKGDPSVRPVYIDIPYFNTPGAWARLPGVRSNWSLRAALGAYLGLRGHVRRLQGAFFHTQITALLSGSILRRIPSIVSLDATPLQYDALGAHYGHAGGNPRVERIKRGLNDRVFAGARGLVTWSQWAKDSLVSDYGVPAEKVQVIPPGVDIQTWDFSAARSRQRTGPVNLLFVGADFPRKGGDTLLGALEALPPSCNAHLHIVTKTEDLGPAALRLEERLTVHRGVTPNSERLLALFAEADLFVFPTRADCLPVAVLEALAASLPVITTSVAALPEAVTHGCNGWIVPPDDPVRLAEAITALSGDGLLRERLSRQARETARERFDGAANYRRVVEAIKQVAR